MERNGNLFVSFLPALLGANLRPAASDLGAIGKGPGDPWEGQGLDPILRVSPQGLLEALGFSPQGLPSSLPLVSTLGK